MSVRRGTGSAFASELRIRSQTDMTRVRSGGRKPAVGRETHLQRRFRNCSVDCRPVCWRTLLQPRSSNHRGLTPPLLFANVRSYIAKVAFPCECVARSPRGAYAPRSCSRAFARRRNCDLCDAQTHMHQERRALARHGSGNVLAQAPPQMFGTLPTDVLAHVVAIAVA